MTSRPNSRKAIVILNPHAHSGALPEAIDQLHDEFSAQLREALSLESVEWSETQHPGHGKELAEDAVRKGYGYIFAGGGDGTINEVLNGIMNETRDKTQRPVLGVLPFGTSNDFFVGLKKAEEIRKVNPSDNLTLALDVGHVWFDDVERYFCLTTGVGLFSWANEQYLEASHAFGRRFAHIPAALSTIFSYRFLPNVTIARNGKRKRSRRILSVVVNNSPVIAGGTLLTPDAKIDDGLFDVCIIRPVSVLYLLWLLFQIRLNTHTRSRALELGRVREVIVTSKQPLPIHVDGELVPELDSKARHMKVEMMPSALHIVIPSLCEILPKTAETVASSTGS